MRAASLCHSLMSFLGAPLEGEEVEELRRLFPEYRGELPEEAWFWSRSDLELFLGSGGQLRPRETVDPADATSPLLTRIRHALAEGSIGEATAEYRSFCRHLKEREELYMMPGSQESAIIQRSAKAPDFLKAPVLLGRPKGWRAAVWGLGFWSEQHGDEMWRFATRSPTFAGDSRGSAVDAVSVEGSVAEYANYARALQKMDPSCAVENGVAFPRLAMEGWVPFSVGARPLFEECWRELLPGGLRDLTARWVKLLAATFDLDWLELLARFFRVNIGAPGSISRLHCQNHGAHAWYSQLEGRRFFVAFSPRDVAAGCLYEDTAAVVEGAGSWTASASPVDIFFPSQRRHPKFAEARAQTIILRPGDTLVVPAGWWHYSVALEPSVTLHHPFWNLQNRTRIVDEFQDIFEESRMPPELQELAAAKLAELREKIAEDEDSDMDD